MGPEEEQARSTGKSLWDMSLMMEEPPRTKVVAASTAAVFLGKASEGFIEGPKDPT